MKSSRRGFMKWSLVTGGATLAGLGLLKYAHAQEVCPPPPPPPPPGTDPMPLPEGLQAMPGGKSPATTPWARAIADPADSPASGESDSSGQSGGAPTRQGLRQSERPGSGE